MAGQSQTRGSQRGNPDKKGPLADEEIRKKGSDMAYYLLCREKHRELHKKADLMKAVDLNGRRKEDQERALEIARNHLRHIFGIKVLLLNTEDHGAKYKDMIMLVNELKVGFKASDLDAADLKMLDKKEGAHTGLLFVILGLIWMSNGRVREDALNGFLRSLGLVKDDDLDNSRSKRSRTRGGDDDENKKSDMIRETFGDVKNLIMNEWSKKQHYICSEMVCEDEESGEPVHEFRWGIRAQCEVRKSQMLNIISQIYGCKPCEFKQQYDEVIEQEGKNAFDDDLEEEEVEDDQEPMDTN